MKLKLISLICTLFLAGIVAKADEESLRLDFILSDFQINDAEVFMFTGLSLEVTFACQFPQPELTVFGRVPLAELVDTPRKLKPTLDPFAKKASWILSSETCPENSIFFNGIGLRKFDPKTGKATIFVTRFIPTDLREPDFYRTDLFLNSSGMFAPTLDIEDLNEYPAKCDFESGDSKFYVCKLKDGHGYVRFEMRPKVPEWLVRLASTEH